MFLVRPADPCEHRELTALAHRAKAAWGYPIDMLAAWADDLTLTADYISDADVFCAVESGRVVGVGALHGCDSGLELEHLWVEPDCFRRGIGRFLVDVAVDHASACGVSSVRVVSDPNAEGFYVAMGAVTVGTVDSVPPGRRIPVMELPVPLDDRAAAHAERNTQATDYG